MSRPGKSTQSGSALLAVLWLSAALSAIAFTVATSVRAETERTSTDVDALRTYYLATGAIDRAMLYMEWGPLFRNPDGSSRYYAPPESFLNFQFASGDARVEIVPESAKLNINSARPEELMALMLALGVDPERAQAIVAGIVDWRSPSPAGAFTQFDQYYLSRPSSFQSRHASFQEIEELLLIRGVTPDLFYGGFARNPDGKLVAHAALRDCVSAWGSLGPIDVNSAPPAVMQAIGISPSAVAGIVALRQNAPIRTMDQLAAFRDSGPGVSRLGLQGNSYATLRATARLRLSNGRMSDLQRSVSALVKFQGFDKTPRFVVMRWYDNAYTPAP